MNCSTLDSSSFEAEGFLTVYWWKVVDLILCLPAFIWFGFILFLRIGSFISISNCSLSFSSVSKRNVLEPKF